MKKTFLSLLIALPFIIQAQVPKRMVAEHFTNTLCSICASKNPGLLSNAFMEPELIHLSIHPSSPYAACVLNQHNVAGNNDRAIYYGVLGSTPRLVINGDVLPLSANYSNTTIYGPYRAQTSPAIVYVTAERNSSTYTLKIVVKTAATHSLPNLRLFAGVAEDTLFYAAPNGEQRHYDVFRAWSSAGGGAAVTLPAVVGDSIVLTQSVNIRAEWDLQRIYPFVILQEESSKDLVQATAIKASAVNVVSGIFQAKQLLANVYPNPAGKQINIEWEGSEPARVDILNTEGKVVSTQTLQVPGLVQMPDGIGKVCYVSVQSGEGRKVYTLIVE